jgi:hypothetical protein
MGQEKARRRYHERARERSSGRDTFLAWHARRTASDRSSGCRVQLRVPVACAGVVSKAVRQTFPCLTDGTVHARENKRSPPALASCGPMPDKQEERANKAPISRARSRERSRRRSDPERAGHTRPHCAGAALDRNKTGPGRRHWHWPLIGTWPWDTRCFLSAEAKRVRERKGRSLRSGVPRCCVGNGLFAGGLPFEAVGQSP